MKWFKTKLSLFSDINEFFLYMISGFQESEIDVKMRDNLLFIIKELWYKSVFYALMLEADNIIHKNSNLKRHTL